MVVCPMLEEKRDGEILEKWRSLDNTKKTASILFKGEEYQKTGYMIKKDVAPQDMTLDSWELGVYVHSKF